MTREFVLHRIKPRDMSNRASHLLSFPFTSIREIPFAIRMVHKIETKESGSFKYAAYEDHKNVKGAT